MNVKEKGYLGEETAAEYFRSHGYEILEQNYTVRGGEVDIIARDSDTLVFIEVKSRAFGTAVAAEAVDSRKISRMLICAERYVTEKKDICSDMKIRFDCVEVYFMHADNAAEIRHIKNIDVY